MDTSFDLAALLKQQRPSKKTYKEKPAQFVTVEGGVQKRFQSNINKRRNSRLSVFDRIRNITRCESPKAPNLSDAQQKALHRQQQLQKWKEEKDRKKKEAAAQKKKPFLAGVSQRSTFGRPPTPPKPNTNTTRRVTRSQSRLKMESETSKAQTKSFAPRNAAFRPTIVFKTEVPSLVTITKKKTRKSEVNITFEPVPPNTNLQKETKTTRARPVANKPVVDKMKKSNEKTKAPPLKQQIFKSSSSSSDTDVEQPRKQRSKPSLRKPIIKTQKKPLPMAQACNLQEAASMSSQDSELSSQGSQDALTSQDSQVALISQDSQDALTSQDSQDSLTSQDSKDALMSQDSKDALTPHYSRVALISQDSQDALTSQDSQDALMIQITETMSSQNELSTPRDKIPKSESSSEEKLRSPKEVNMPLTPEEIAEEVKNISPCVTMSRGKDNARREMKKKLEEGLLDEDNNNLGSLNYLRRQLDSEIARITATCKTWDQIFAQTVLPEPIQELVLTAVGQARLLMSQKFQQFAGLLDKCAHPQPGVPLITPADLHGFWDMVLMQVENIDMRFIKLDELRLRDWIEEQQPDAKKVVAKPAAKKVAAKPTGGPSRLREMIAAARKAKKEQESQSENFELEKSPTGQPAASSETKTFEAGFFRISSPMKRGSLAPGTPNNASLLKTVLSSEAKKSVSKNSASFAMLRASLISKNVDIEGVSPLMETPTIAPVNLLATPARSILKQNPPSDMKLFHPKKVVFHDMSASPAAYTDCDNTEAEELGVAPLPADDKEDTATPIQALARESSPAGDAACDKMGAEEPGIAPLPADDKENTATPKKASARRSRLPRQNAEDHPTPVIMTRSRNKGTQTPLVETAVERKRNTRKSAPTLPVETHVEKKRTTRRSAQTPLVETHVEKERTTRKSVQTPVVEAENLENECTTRKSAQTPLVEADTNVEKKRSTRKKDAQAEDTESPRRSTRRRKSGRNLDNKINK